METKQKQRLQIIKKIETKKLTLKEAAQELDLSYRQVRRIYKAFRQRGAASLIHGLKGRASNRRLDSDFRSLIMDYYQAYFQDFGPSLARKGLHCMGYSINRETFRRWLIEEKLWKTPGKRRSRKKAKKRKVYFGQKLHIISCNYELDQSEGNSLPLLILVDDVTKIRMCHVGDDSEKSIMAMLRKWVGRYGIPRTVLGNLNGPAKKAPKPKPYKKLAIKMRGSAFARACKKLGIEIQPVDTEELKKHVQWCYDVYRDFIRGRLKQKSGAWTKSGLHRLQKDIDAKYDALPAVKRYKGKDFHKKLEAPHDLNRIFCYEYKRPVSNEWVVEHNGRLFYIAEENTELPSPQETEVKLTEGLDGAVRIYYKNKELKIEELRVKN
jgi:hypothetical protein